MNAPLKAQAITKPSDSDPDPALTPPMMTNVSLGTIGMTESSTAITRMMT
jgi:hypothetical protein